MIAVLVLMITFQKNTEYKLVYITIKLQEMFYIIYIIWITLLIYTHRMEQRI